ncbi:PadR family transcriptional regulator [Alkaliphilus transvaalensis]|uniref:PadR family transcriptional regulator n=1 Tax=Alkaliphilus transvaalensis TaxID=114628 RepID=UPI000479D96E|nr:PadR family transcriptional regulator [Alkaliphilus transvaalensis]
MDLNKEEQVLEGLIQELRRGTIILCVLSQLEEPQYGYSLVVALEEKGMTIDPGTLYPLLRRLEKQEILISNWNTEGSKPRKYYELSNGGKRIYQKLCHQWHEISRSMENFIGKKGE